MRSALVSCALLALLALAVLHARRLRPLETLWDELPPTAPLPVDLDADGRPDRRTSDGFWGPVTLHSATGEPLLTLPCPDPDLARWPTTLSQTPDVDGDAVPDLLATATGHWSKTLTAAYLLSGRTGLPLHTWRSTTPDLTYTSLLPAGDPNHDGIPDLALSGRARHHGTLRPFTRLYSGATLR